MGSLQDLADDLDDLSFGLPAKVNQVVQLVSALVLTEVVKGTPVDIGTARSNWQASISVPVLDSVDAYAPGSHLGIDEQENANAAIAIGKVSISTRKDGEDVWIVNNLDYIQLLNAGSSKQAPQLFVEKAILVGIRQLDNVKII